MKKESLSLDAIDRKLLNLLQENARIPNVELARLVELSPSGLQKRLRKLEQSGLINQYVALLNREGLGYDMVCYINVTLSKHNMEQIREFRETVQQCPEVLECQHITGEYDYLLKVIVRNRDHLEQFLMQTLTPIPSVDRLRTSIVLKEIKSTTAYPL